MPLGTQKMIRSTKKLIELLIERAGMYSGLRIAAGKEKSPKLLEILRVSDLAYTTQFDTMQR